MEFVEKIRQAMQMLHDACAMNDTWRNCQYCPFKDYCDAMEEADLGTPDDPSFLEN